MNLFMSRKVFNETRIAPRRRILAREDQDRRIQQEVDVLRLPSWAAS